MGTKRFEVEDFLEGSKISFFYGGQGKMTSWKYGGAESHTVSLQANYDRQAGQSARPKGSKTKCGIT